MDDQDYTNAIELAATLQPADELHALRAIEAELKRRIQQLRDGFLDGSLNRNGNDWIVVIKTSTFQTITTKAAKALLKPEVYAQLASSHDVNRLILCQRGKNAS
jgi:hypothetical protein